MTSRTAFSKAHKPAPRRRSRKNIVILAVILVALVILYTIGWIHIAGKVEARAKRDLANLTASGVGARCENLHTEGYPLRINVVCDTISWQRPSAGISFQAGSFASGSPVYSPRSLSNVLIGPALIELPGIQPLEANWSSFTSSAQLAKPFPTEITLAARDLNIALRSQSSASTALSSLEQLKVEMKGFDSALRLTGRFAGLTFRPAVIGNGKSPEIDGVLDVQLTNAATFLSNRPGRFAERLRGEQGTINQALLSLPNGAMISLSGPFSVDEAGLIDASLKVTMVNPQALAQAGQVLFPDQSGNIATVMFGMSAMPRDENGNPVLNIDISKGKARAGFIPLGRVPSL